MGLRLGLMAGHGKTVILASEKALWVVRAVYGRALSCIKTKFSPTLCENGMLWGRIIRSTYREAVMEPSSRITSSVLPSKLIPAHTITFGPPKRSLSRMQGSEKRSPSLLHTSLDDHRWKTSLLLSSVKNKFLQLSVVHSACSRANLKRAARCAIVNFRRITWDLERCPSSWSWFRMVWSPVRVPVDCRSRFCKTRAKIVRSRRAVNLIYRSSWTVVARALPDPDRLVTTTWL